MSQYQREIDAVARRLAPKIPAETPDGIEPGVWKHADEWDHLVDRASEDRFVGDVAKTIAAIREKEGSEIARALANLGFTIRHTGGNCQAFERFSDDGGYVLVADYDCGLPGTWAEPVAMGSFGPDGSQLGDDVHFDSARGFVDSMRKESGIPRRSNTRVLRNRLKNAFRSTS